MIVTSELVEAGSCIIACLRTSVIVPRRAQLII
jgi:hypothetical protein